MSYLNSIGYILSYLIIFCLFKSHFALIICIYDIFLFGQWGILCEISTVRHHSDWDFNETHCIGLFHPKNKLVSVKIPYAKNFAEKPPMKSDQHFSILAIT